MPLPITTLRYTRHPYAPTHPVLRKLVEGRRFAYPDPPALPEYRVSSASPFSAVGIDYTGLLLVKNSTGPTKVYVALFSCCVTRAIHLEVAEDCSKEQFMLLFRRFCARRSIPTTVVTDNASCFLSVEDEITQLLDEPEVKAYLNSNGIRWIHIPGRSPAWSGFYERMVGIMKTCLKKAYPV